MNYILKQSDNDLLYFSMENTNDGLDVKICMSEQEIKIEQLFHIYNKNF